MSAITTHVLDQAAGRPAEGVGVRLEKRGDGGRWSTLAERRTDADGRVRDFFATGEALASGVYRLTFDTGAYFGSRNIRTFLPEAAITFEVFDAAQHHHVPLLLGPFGFTTYRGS